MAVHTPSGRLIGRRALVVDLWDTLTVPSFGARDQLVGEVGALLGVDPTRFAEVYAATFPQRARGELGDLRATLRSVCQVFGAVPDEDAVDRAVRRRLEATTQLMRFRDDAAPTLATFRSAGWVVGLVTDSSCDSEAVWATTTLSKLVDAAVFSCAERVVKPAGELFEMAASRLGVSAEECCYVADGRSGELAAASSVGMRAIRLAIEVEHPDAEVWQGETVARLGDLAGLLLSFIEPVVVRC